MKPSTAVERLAAAIEKLETLRGGSQDWRVVEDEEGPQVWHEFDTDGHGPGSGTMAWTTSVLASKNIVTLYRTIDAQLVMLKSALILVRPIDGQASFELGTGSRVGQALALADAILGGAE